jgi:hypothetical protein
MKTYKQFLSESVNISGNASIGTLIVNGSDASPSSVGEQFYADFMWEGKLYRVEMEGTMLSKNEIAEHLQTQYPGAIVHNVYPIYSDNTLNIKNTKRYQPERLTWGD